MKTKADPFADALESYWRVGKGSFRYTREDGWTQIEDAWWYFTTFRDFLAFEKKALKFAAGRILDVGCGAGRHSLYLGRKGFQVTALDVSPRLARISTARGVSRVCVASACANLPFGSTQFDTVLLFGNNLGICGTRLDTVALLQELARVTSFRARILATTRAPSVSGERELGYWNSRLAEGKQIGEVTFRLDYRGKNRSTVSLLLLAPTDLIRLAYDSGWVVEHFFGEDNPTEGYSAVLRKRA